jgi:hypothetical protein
VPAIDATGLVNLESAIDRLHAGGVFTVLAGVQRQPARALARSGLRERRDRVSICRSLETAASVARRRSRAEGWDGSQDLLAGDLDETLS